MFKRLKSTVLDILSDGATWEFKDILVLVKL